jgi:carbohydrate kinase (thermoresistant glucokinase family)
VIVIIMGVSGSGKSTLLHAFTASLGWPGLEADELHPASNVQKMARGVPLDDADRRPWLEAVAAVVSRWKESGTSGVAACSALGRWARDALRAADPDCLFVYLEAQPALIEKRLGSRTGHFMPAALAQSQFEALEPPDPSEGALKIPAGQRIEESVERVVAEIARRG